MGILDKLFGSQPSQKLRLVRELARHRIKTDPAAPFLGMEPAMIDALNDNQLMMLPEASIATIVETYVALIKEGMTSQAAIQRIDQFRSESFGGKSSSHTQNIFNFVIDRVRIEHTDGPQLDEAFIDTATLTSAKVFGIDLTPPDRPPYHVVEEFEISTFHLILATYTRREGGYLFPWRLMAFDSRTGNFAFSYNLEVTPISCCLGAYTSEKAHLNLGSGDPKMTLGEFQSWAIPKAIDKIYGDHVLTPDEAHVFGVKVVADYLGKVGVDVLNINKEPLKDPQIYGMKDGRTAAILVRVGTYPEKGELDEDEPSVSELIGDCLERDYDLYFASVGLANANARNEYERGALLRNGSFHVAFSGIEQIV